MPDLESIARDRAARITQLEQWCNKLELDRAALMKRVERAEALVGLSEQSAEWVRRETIEALGRTSEARNETRQVKSALDEARADAARMREALELARITIQEFGAFLDAWSIVPRKKSSSVYGAWDRVRSEGAGVEEIDAALTESASRWRSTSEAPLDGTRMLLWDAAMDPPEYIGLRRGVDWFDDHGHLVQSPTHCMPLPEPPKEEL